MNETKKALKAYMLNLRDQPLLETKIVAARNKESAINFVLEHTDWRGYPAVDLEVTRMTTWDKAIKESDMMPRLLQERHAGSGIELPPDLPENPDFQLRLMKEVVEGLTGRQNRIKAESSWAISLLYAELSEYSAHTQDREVSAIYGGIARLKRNQMSNHKAIEEVKSRIKSAIDGLKEELVKNYISDEGGQS